MNRELANYLAGLLEVGGWIGEGPMVTATAPRDICLRLARRTGVGETAPAYTGPDGTRMYTWRVDGDQATIILQAILPFFSQSRKQQVQQALFAPDPEDPETGDG